MDTKETLRSICSKVCLRANQAQPPFQTPYLHMEATQECITQVSRTTQTLLSPDPMAHRSCSLPARFLQCQNQVRLYGIRKMSPHCIQLFDRGTIRCRTANIKHPLLSLRIQMSFVKCSDLAKALSLHQPRITRSHTLRQQPLRLELLLAAFHSR